MKYCNKCSREYNDNENFCEVCGEKLSVVVDAQQENNYQQNNQGEGGYGAEQNYTNPGMYITERNIAISIILSIITCGIYGIYWFVKINDEINYLANDTTATNGITVFLLTLVTCGIYGIYWAYKMGEKSSMLKGDLQGSDKILMLVLAIFGFQIVNYALLQDVINKRIYA